MERAKNRKPRMWAWRVAAGGIVCAAVATTWAKPILPHAPDRVVGQKGVEAVDHEAVARDRKARFEALAALEAERARLRDRRERLTAGQEALSEDPAAALAIAEQIVAANPEDREALALRDKAQDAIARQAEEARRAAERAEAERLAAERAAASARISGLLGEADAFLDEGQFDAAEGKYREALALDAGNRGAQRGLEKVASARARQVEEARRAAERAEAERLAAERAAASARAEALTSEGEALLRSGSVDAAEAKFSEALQIMSDSRDARKGLARVARARADRLAAEVKERVGQGDAALARGDFAEAEAHYRNALSADPGNRAAEKGLARVAEARQSQARLAAHEAELLEVEGLLVAGRADEALNRVEALLRESLSRDHKSRARDLRAAAKRALRDAEKTSGE